MDKTVRLGKKIYNFIVALPMLYHLLIKVQSDTEDLIMYSNY